MSLLIVLDTNILFRDPLMNGADAVAIKDAAVQLGYIVSIPEIVLDEMVNKRTNQLADAANILTKSIKTAQTLGLRVDDIIQSDGELAEVMQTYRLQLNDLFPESTRLPYPNESHSRVAARAIKSTVC